MGLINARLNQNLSNRASRCGVPPSTPLADSPTRRRGKMSLLIRRDATLRISGALHLALFEQPARDEFLKSLLELQTSKFKRQKESPMEK